MSPGADSVQLDWLILGGGIHGTHLGVCLVGEAGIPREQVRIVDPEPRLLEGWRRRANATGMTYLRSTSVHHLDPDPLSLRRLARRPEHRFLGQFAAPYDRPHMDLFTAHCDEVLGAHALEELHHRGRAVECDVHAEGVEVELADGSRISTRNVALALGAAEHPEWPDWAPKGHDRVRHLFGPDRSAARWTDGSRLVVIGGGISAAQISLRLSRDGHSVEWLSRDGLREKQFDIDPGWLGPKCMSSFRRETNLARRRELIQAARGGGSIPKDVLREVRAALRRREILHAQATIVGLEDLGDRILLTDDQGASYEADGVVLATGFSAARPGGALVDGMIQSARLPCAPCGYPHLDEALRWHPRVRALGPLAELELGPVARNIAGAQRAGERILASLARSVRPLAEVG